jgi:serine protease Do
VPALTVLAFTAAAAPLAVAPDFTRVAEAASPWVVNITAQLAPPPDASEADAPPFDESSGSGVVVGADGWVVTNHHVIANATDITVRLADRRELSAKLVGTDPASDIALLKVEASKLPAARIGNPAKLRPGEWVLAIGAPFGFEYSVTAGIVSAKGRSVGAEQYVPYLQTDVAVNPGNSGGPLVNLRGEVVGINSQIFSETGSFTGISFAVPIDLAMEVVGQLRSQGKVVRGWLGINIQDVTRDLAESFAMPRPVGALVRGLATDGPATAAGIEVGDVILAFDGKLLRSSEELPPLVGRTAPGKRVALQLLRAGKPLTLSATVGELPPAAPPPAPRTAADGDRLGLGLRDLDAGERRALDLESGGAVVDAVGDGPAADAGLEPGDVVLMVNQTRIASAAQLAELIDGLAPGRAVALLLLRDGQTQFVPLRIPAP